MAIRRSFRDMVEIETAYLRAWEHLIRLVRKQLRRNPPQVKLASKNLRGVLDKVGEVKRAGIARRKVLYGPRKIRVKK